MAYYLSYYNDTLAAGASLTFPDDGIHRLFYVHQGKAEIDRQTVSEDEAVYRHGSATVTGAGGGARIFRWELGPSAGKAPGNIESVLRMTRECWMLDIQNGNEWLFRLDSIVHNPPDPAVSRAYPGDPWWETGTEAVISTPVGETPVHFLRGMLLPTTFKGRPDTAKWLRAKPKQKSAWKLYVDQVIKL